MKGMKNFSSHEPASKESISNAERQLALRFSDEYKEYLCAFGHANGDGHEFTGIIDDQYTGVVNVTNEERGYNFLIPENLYVIENLGINDIIIWQHENGKIYRGQRNFAPIKIHDSLVEYIISTKS